MTRKKLDNDQREFSSCYWRIEFEDVVCPELDETIAKPLSSKSKFPEFFGALSQQQQQSTSPTRKNSRKQNPFPRIPLLQAP